MWKPYCSELNMIHPTTNVNRATFVKAMVEAVGRSDPSFSTVETFGPQRSRRIRRNRKFDMNTNDNKLIQCEMIVCIRYAIVSLSSVLQLQRLRSANPSGSDCVMSKRRVPLPLRDHSRLSD